MATRIGNMKRKGEGPPVDLVVTPRGLVQRQKGWMRWNPQQREAVSLLEQCAVDAQRVEFWTHKTVLEARAAGISWHQIGLVLNMTGEGARRKFVADLPRHPDQRRAWPPAGESDES